MCPISARSTSTDPSSRTTGRTHSRDHYAAADVVLGRHRRATVTRRARRGRGRAGSARRRRRWRSPQSPRRRRQAAPPPQWWCSTPVPTPTHGVAGQRRGDRRTRRPRPRAPVATAAATIPRYRDDATDRDRSGARATRRDDPGRRVTGTRLADDLALGDHAEPVTKLHCCSEKLLLAILT